MAFLCTFVCTHTLLWHINRRGVCVASSQGDDIINVNWVKVILKFYLFLSFFYTTHKSHRWNNWKETIYDFIIVLYLKITRLPLLDPFNRLFPSFRHNIRMHLWFVGIWSVFNIKKVINFLNPRVYYVLLIL